MVRSHHFIVFMLDNMAMPDVEAGIIELHLDTRNLAGVGDDRVFEAFFPRLRRLSSVGAPTQHFELDQVDMDGMRVLREIVDFPFFGSTYSRIFRD